MLGLPALPVACPTVQALPATCQPLETTGRAGTWVRSSGESYLRSQGLTGVLVVHPALPVCAWADGFRDGTDPQAAPVPTSLWVSAVEEGGQPAGAVLLDVDQEVTATWVPDTLLATAVLTGAGAGTDAGAGEQSTARPTTGAEGPAIVRDDDGAWFAVSEGTVTAMDALAHDRLAGPVSLETYSAVLAKAAQASARADPAPRGGGPSWQAWLTAGVVLGLGALAVVGIILRERRRTAVLLGHGATGSGPASEASQQG